MELTYYINAYLDGLIGYILVIIFTLIALAILGHNTNQA